MDVKLVEPETARPEPPKQEALRRNTIIAIVLVLLAIVLLVIFTGPDSGFADENSGEMATPPIITSTLTPEQVLGEYDASMNGGNVDLYTQVIQQGGTAEIPLPAANQNPAQLEPTGQRQMDQKAEEFTDRLRARRESPWGDGGYSPSGYGNYYGGSSYQTEDPELESARKSNPIVFQAVPVSPNNPQGAVTSGEVQHPFTPSENPDISSDIRSSVPNMMMSASPYVLLQGTVMPAMMITSLRSDRPGPVIAQITRDVYDARIEHVLVPQGTRLIGTLENVRRADQEYAVLAWSRMVFPDGSYINLPDFTSIETTGESGLSADVSRPWGRAIRQLALVSAFTVGTVAAANQVTGGEAGILEQLFLFQLLNNALETGRRILGVGDDPLLPIVKINAGYRFNVYVVSDLPLPRTWN